MATPSVPGSSFSISHSEVPEAEMKYFADGRPNHPPIHPLHPSAIPVAAVAAPIITSSSLHSASASASSSAATSPRAGDGRLTLTPSTTSSTDPASDNPNPLSARTEHLTDGQTSMVLLVVAGCIGFAFLGLGPILVMNYLTVTYPNDLEAVRNLKPYCSEISQYIKHNKLNLKDLQKDRKFFDFWLTKQKLENQLRIASYERNVLPGKIEKCKEKISELEGDLKRLERPEAPAPGEVEFKEAASVEKDEKEIKEKIEKAKEELGKVENERSVIPGNIPSINAAIKANQDALDAYAKKLSPTRSVAAPEEPDAEEVEDVEDHDEVDSSVPSPLSSFSGISRAHPLTFDRREEEEKGKHEAVELRPPGWQQYRRPTEPVVLPATPSAASPPLTPAEADEVAQMKEDEELEERLDAMKPASPVPTPTLQPGDGGVV